MIISLEGAVQKKLAQYKQKWLNHVSWVDSLTIDLSENVNLDDL
jgi:hypothetical protein